MSRRAGALGGLFVLVGVVGSACLSSDPVALLDEGKVVVGKDAGAPKCGDGICDPAEDETSCSQDCKDASSPSKPSKAPPPFKAEYAPACDSAFGSTAPISVKTSAPLGAGVHQLGRPFDRHFQPFAGPGGASLFPNAQTFDTPLNVMEHRYVVIEDTRSLDANVSAWGIASGDVGIEKHRRYASYRAYQIEHVVEIDDATVMKAAPADAEFYLSRIFFGHSYEVVAYGTDSKFNASIKASFMIASGSIETFAESHQLSTSAFGRGLTPINGSAIFAKTADEIEAAYSTDGPSVPIFVEYRSIPKACVENADPIPWAGAIQVQLKLDDIDIYQDGSWGKDTWSLEAKCALNGQETFLTNPNVWDQKSDISDNCESGLIGPSGGETFCKYPVNWSTWLEALEGDLLECGISGTAWDNGKQVPYAGFSFTVQKDNQPSKGQFGAGGANSPEYWMFYSLAFPSL